MLYNINPNAESPWSFENEPDLILLHFSPIISSLFSNYFFSVLLLVFSTQKELSYEDYNKQVTQVRHSLPFNLFENQLSESVFTSSPFIEFKDLTECLQPQTFTSKAPSGKKSAKKSYNHRRKGKKAKESVSLKQIFVDSNPS